MKFHNNIIQSDYELFCYIGGIIDPTFKAPEHIQQMMLHCPAHDDQNPSLAFTVENDRVLLDCHAKHCSFKEILAACGLNESDGFLYERNGNQDNSYRSRYNLATRKEMPKSNESMNNEDDKEISLKSIESIDANDTEEKQAKRQTWAFSELSEADYAAINARYGFPVPVLRLLAENELLFKWYDRAQNPCWCLTDGSQHSAQAVRLDGEPFYKGNKKHTLPGSLTSYPIGWSLVVDAVKCLRLTPTYRKQCLFLVCEGVTDYLAGWCLASRFNMVFHLPMVLPLGILGATVKPSKEIVETLTGCNVRLAFDNDSAGEKAEEVWWTVLERKSKLSRIEIEHFEKKDIRDLWNMVKPGENPTTETIETVKGELIYA